MAPCPGRTGQVVKASKVHFPQPFLISDGIKNCCKNSEFLNTLVNYGEKIFFNCSGDGSRKTGVGNRKSEVGRRESEDRSPETETE